jgi:hypothetical protein
MAATLFGVAALAEGEGGQSDPLVTLSYIDKVFTNYILDLFQDELDKKTAELEAGLNTKISEIEKAYGASGAVVERSTYSVISLADGQTLVCQRGAEIMLRVGSAVVAADDSPGLVDTSTTENLDNGKALTKNHMYMVTINDHGVKARGSVKVLVRGDYVIK